MWVFVQQKMIRGKLMQAITLQMLALHRRRHCIRQQLFQRQQRRLFWIWQKPFNWNSLEISRPEVLSKKDVPRNFTKFTGKHLSHPLVQVFSCEFCEILKTRFYTEHLWWLLLLVYYLIATVNLNIELMIWKGN